MKSESLCQGPARTAANLRQQLTTTCADAWFRGVLASEGADRVVRDAGLLVAPLRKARRRMKAHLAAPSCQLVVKFRGPPASYAHRACPVMEQRTGNKDSVVAVRAEGSSYRLVPSADANHPTEKKGAVAPSNFLLALPRTPGCAARAPGHEAVGNHASNAGCAVSRDRSRGADAGANGSPTLPSQAARVTLFDLRNVWQNGPKLSQRESASGGRWVKASETLVSQLRAAGRLGNTEGCLPNSELTRKEAGSTAKLLTQHPSKSPIWAGLSTANHEPRRLNGVMTTCTRRASNISSSRRKCARPSAARGRKFCQARPCGVEVADSQFGNVHSKGFFIRADPIGGRGPERATRPAPHGADRVFLVDSFGQPGARFAHNRSFAGGPGRFGVRVLVSRRGSRGATALAGVERVLLCAAAVGSAAQRPALMGHTLLLSDVADFMAGLCEVTLEGAARQQCPRRLPIHW